MMHLPFSLDRTVVINAAPELVFTFFTDSDRWASWWGAGSTIDPCPGGAMLIKYPNGIEAAGEVIEVSPPERVVFTYGFTSGTPMPAGSSRVTIRLEPDGHRTRLFLTHELADATVRDHHVQGWRYQLSVFANVVADLANENAASLADAWFEVWSEAQDAVREERLKKIAAADVRFADRFGLLSGIADLVPHIAAAQRFMPDMRLTRSGDVRHCQGTLLVDWIAASRDGQERGRGTNVFTLRGDGLIESVVGFWAPAAR